MSSSAPRGNLNKHSSQNPLQQFFIRRFKEKVADFARAIPPGAWCEAGCGEGFVLRYLLDHKILKDVSVNGIDLDESALEFAAGLIPEVRLQRASVYEMPFQGKQFRCVMMLEVLEHLAEPTRALDEAKRTGEYLLLSVPHEPWFCIANFLRGKNWKHWGSDPEHVQWWNVGSFKKLLSNYGEILRIETTFPWIVALIKV